MQTLDKVIYLTAFGKSLKQAIADGDLSGASSSGGIFDWVTSHSYLVGNGVYQSNKLYKCLIAHTSGVFATDLAASKWIEISTAITDHTALTNIGTNTHAQIDTYISTTAPAYVQSQSIINALIFG